MRSRTRTISAPLRVRGPCPAREVGPTATSGVEELVGEIVRAEPAEESPKPHGQLARKTTPSDEDTRVSPTGLNPLAMQTLEVRPVVGEEDPVCICSNL